jgi:ribonuclease-3
MLSTLEDPRNLALCQKKLGYAFQNIQLLEMALTHASGANTRLVSYERLEFLGDAVLGFLVSEFLYERFPEESEGSLTHRKSAIVSRDMCIQWSKDLGLEAFIQVGKGVINGGVPPNIVGDIFEAVLGAIYLDRGVEPVRAFLWPRLEKNPLALLDQEKNNQLKSQFQQYCQKNFGVTPYYSVIDEQGPDHCKCFKVAAKVVDIVFPAAWGNTKKEAEQKAAANAMAQLLGETLPYPES